MSVEYDDLAQALAKASSPAAMRGAAIELSKPGLTSRAAKHPAFGTALSRLLDWVQGGEELDRLHALTVLARLRRQNRGLPSDFEQELLRPISPLLAPPTALDDPKEREYLAQGLGLIRFEGQARFLAEFVAGEGQTQTEARLTAASGLLQVSTSLSEAFNELADALVRQVHDTQDPVTSRSRRLLRVLEALQSALRTEDPPVGPEPGEAFARLLKTSLSDRAERAVSIDATNVAIAVLLAWVRPNFSAALSPRTFDGIAQLRRLFLPARWPDETRHSREALGRLMREAIALLAQAGVTDQKLRDSLVLLLDEPVAAGMLRSVAKESPGIPNEVRHWLETGHAVVAAESGAAVAESVLEMIDRDLAEAFRESQAASVTLSTIKGELEEAVALSQPALAAGSAELFGRVGRLVRRLEAIAAKRGFELQGAIGETVEYAPSDHASDHPIAGTRNVRLLSPMVVRRTATGAPQVILKGKVEGA